jgi:hypothetical protein
VYEQQPSRSVTPALIVGLVVLGALVGGGSWYVTGNLLSRSDQAQVAATTTPPASPSTTPGPACPTLTEQAAVDAGSPGGLTQVLWIETDPPPGSSPNNHGSEVWICRDTAGKLWYQGHRRQFPFPSATSSYSLLLSTVEQTGDFEFTATNVTSNGTTSYLVSRTTLVIEDPSKSTTEVVTQSDPAA